MKYVKSLDGLRGLAVILVMFIHAGLAECGWIGVQLFFVLSGYLITSILMLEKNEEAGFFFKRFYWRRSLRIFPVYFAYIFGAAVIWKLTGAPADLPNKFPWLASYTFNIAKTFGWVTSSQFFTHFWSLAIEEQFYLVWPFLVYFLPRWTLKKLALSIILLAPVARYVFGAWMLGNGASPAKTALAIYFFTPTQLDALMFGALIPIFDLDKRVKNPLQAFAGGFALFALAGLTNLLLALPHATRNDLGYIPMSLWNLQHVWSYTVVNFFALTLVLFLIGNQAHWVRTFFSNPILTQIGKVSYGVYIFHWAIMVGFEKWIGAVTWLTFWPYLGIVFALSKVSYCVVEKPFIALKDRWLTKPAAMRVPLGAEQTWEKEQG